MIDAGKKLTWEQSLSRSHSNVSSVTQTDHIRNELHSQSLSYKLPLSQVITWLIN